MAGHGCDLACEIRYGSELSFEEAGEMEALLQRSAQEALAGLDPDHVDFRTTGDEVAFLGSVRGCGPGELREVCERLRAVMDPGAQGRLVAVGRGFGPVTVWRFSSLGVEEAVCAR